MQANGLLTNSKIEVEVVFLGREELLDPIRPSQYIDC
jgi:hypothetical protein